MDTIYALATARGRAGVAVIRISGSLAWEAAERLVGRLPEVRKASLRRLMSRENQLLDEALVLVFDQDQSFTGEKVAELQLHGSVAVVQAVLAELAAMDGLRMADPGEFTRRALESGRMDLAQVEGLADLIDAETEAQRVQAQRVLSGAIGSLVEGWRPRLIRAAALLEAVIDFADEDVPVDVAPDVLELLDGLIAEMGVEIRGGAISERLRDGFEVAIIGAPNAGKSTLLNSLAGREAAITSSRAGTTRDVIELRMDLAGMAVTLLDTAGLRAAEDEIEEIGIRRAIARAEVADLRVLLLDDSEAPGHVALQPDDIVVHGKADLPGTTGCGLAVSGLTGAGVDALVERIADVLARRVSGAATITRARHRNALIGAVVALESARGIVMSGNALPELAAEEIRTALRALESLVGRVDVEHLLGEIFASFCIGK